MPRSGGMEAAVSYKFSDFITHNLLDILRFEHRISGHKSDLSILNPAFVSAGAQNLGGVRETAFAVNFKSGSEAKVKADHLLHGQI